MSIYSQYPNQPEITPMPGEPGYPVAPPETNPETEPIQPPGVPETPMIPVQPEIYPDNPVIPDEPIEPQPKEPDKD